LETVSNAGFRARYNWVFAQGNGHHAAIAARKTIILNMN
jgi:hypothetical protein